MTLIQLLSMKISYDYTGDSFSIRAQITEKEAEALRHYIIRKIQRGRFPRRFHGRFSELGD